MRVRVADISGDEVSGVRDQLGVVLGVRVADADLDRSVARALSIASFVTNQMCFAHAASIEEPLPFVAFQVDPDISERVFCQWIRDLPIATPRRRYRPEQMEALRVAFASSTLPDTHKKRVGRAIHYLRKSHLEHDPVDRFEDVWNGLESLNPVLQAKHALPDTHPAKCPTCHAKYNVQGNSSGIQFAVVNLAQHAPAEWGQLNKFRQKIVHGFGDLAEISRDVGSMTKVAADALVSGLSDALMPHQIDATILRRAPLVLPVGAPSLFIRCVLQQFPGDLLRDNMPIPYFTVGVTTKSRVATGTRRHEQFSLTWDPHDVPGPYRDFEYELLLPRDPEGPMPTATVQHVETRGLETPQKPH